jgi:hypothetical protein
MALDYLAALMEAAESCIKPGEQHQIGRRRSRMRRLSRYERRMRRRLKNVSRNRPDATNLNHQNANRRVFMCLSCNAVCCTADRPKLGARV